MTTMNSIFAADEGAAPLAVTGSRTAWSDYPGEKPRKDDLGKWLDSWTDDITQSGCAPLLRGEDTYELKKLAPRKQLAIPSDAGLAENVKAKNAEIQHTNEVNAEEREARLREIKFRLGARLSKASQPTV